jgi:hypothetical protein
LRIRQFLIGFSLFTQTLFVISPIDLAVLPTACFARASAIRVFVDVVRGKLVTSFTVFHRNLSLIVKHNTPEVEGSCL